MDSSVRFDTCAISHSYLSRENASDCPGRNEQTLFACKFRAKNLSAKLLIWRQIVAVCFSEAPLQFQFSTRNSAIGNFVVSACICAVVNRRAFAMRLASCGFAEWNSGRWRALPKNRQRVTEKGASYAWGNRGSSDSSLVAWIFRISCHVRIDSYCSGGCSDHADSASGQGPRVNRPLGVYRIELLSAKQSGVMSGIGQPHSYPASKMFLTSSLNDRHFYKSFLRRP